MQQQIQNLTTKANQYLRKNFVEIDRYDIDQVRKDIDSYIDIVKKSNQLRSDMAKIFSEALFNESKINILHIIAKFGSVEQLEKIVDIAGIEIVNSLDSNKFSPLHHASINGRDDIVTALINSQADRDALSSQETRKWHSIHFACRYGHLKIVKFFIDLGIHKEIRTGFGLSPLHVACEFGKIEIVKYLLNIGVEKDPVTIDENQNMTPLHYAVVGNFQALTDILLIAGVDKNKCDITGLSALDIASKNNLSEMVRLLLKWGVKNFETAFQISKTLNNKETNEIISKYINARDCLFQKSTLKKLSSELSEMIGKFNSDNLANPLIKIFGNVEFNAFGIFNLYKVEGFFSKKEIDFAQFVENNKIHDLNNALDYVKEIIINNGNLYIKKNLENL